MGQLLRLSKDKLPAGIGQKAKSIHWLMERGLSVPETFALNYEWYHAFLKDRSKFKKELENVLKLGLDLEIEYAVRSSANIEDGLDYSLAGQLESFLSVKGVQNLVDAVIQIYESIHFAKLAPYLEKIKQSAGDIQMAVIIQKMIQPKVSGVLFSKNPITGLDEIIIEAVRGSGELLMQEGITPERWIYKWGEWKERPKNSQIDTNLIMQVIGQSKTIVDGFNKALDLEWVFDGETLYWLQQRPITTLDKLSIYSNRISREVLPGMIKPLIWSINVPLVNSAWIDLFTELIGSNDFSPEDLSKSFHYRA